MKIPKIKNFRKKIKSIPEKLSQKAFLTFFILFLFFSLLGGLIYYKYLILEVKKEPQILERVFEFDQKKYSEVLEILNQKEKNFNLIEGEKIRDPFRPLLESQTSSIISLPPL